MSNKPPKEVVVKTRRQLKKEAKREPVDPWVSLKLDTWGWHRDDATKKRRDKYCIRRSWKRRARLEFIFEHDGLIHFGGREYLKGPGVRSGVRAPRCTPNQLYACKSYEDFLKLVETEIAIWKMTGEE